MKPRPHAWQRRLGWRGLGHFCRAIDRFMMRAGRHYCSDSIEVPPATPCSDSEGSGSESESSGSDSEGSGSDHDDAISEQDQAAVQPPPGPAVQQAARALQNLRRRASAPAAVGRSPGRFALNVPELPAEQQLPLLPLGPRLPAQPPGAALPSLRQLEQLERRWRMQQQEQAAGSHVARRLLFQPDGPALTQEQMGRLMPQQCGPQHGRRAGADGFAPAAGLGSLRRVLAAVQPAGAGAPGAGSIGRPSPGAGPENHVPAAAAAGAAAAVAGPGRLHGGVAGPPAAHRRGLRRRREEGAAGLQDDRLLRRPRPQAWEGGRELLLSPPFSATPPFFATPAFFASPGRRAAPAAAVEPVAPAGGRLMGTCHDSDTYSQAAQSAQLQRQLHTPALPGMPCPQQAECPHPCARVAVP